MYIRWFIDVFLKMHWRVGLNVMVIISDTCLSALSKAPSVFNVFHTSLNYFRCTWWYCFPCFPCQKLVVLVVNGRNDSDIVRASSGAILARILVQNSGFFAQFTSQQSLAVALQQSGVTSTDQSALFLFFDAWLDKVITLLYVHPVAPKF